MTRSRPSPRRGQLRLHLALHSELVSRSDRVVRPRPSHIVQRPLRTADRFSRNDRDHDRQRRIRPRCSAMGSGLGRPQWAYAGLYDVGRAFPTLAASSRRSRVRRQNHGRVGSREPRWERPRWAQASPGQQWFWASFMGWRTSHLGGRCFSLGKGSRFVLRCKTMVG